MWTVKFEFLNDLGIWKDDHLDNNGEGFCFSEATEVANDISGGFIPTRGVKVVSMNGKQKAKAVNGWYRVYQVIKTCGGKNYEVRYAKKADALTFMDHCGGVLFWTDFPSREIAQRFLDYKLGDIWW